MPFGILGTRAAGEAANERGEESLEPRPEAMMKKVGELFLILLATAVVCWGLAIIAAYARVEGAKMTVADFDQAKEWGTALVGLAGTVAGFLGVAASTRQNINAAERTTAAGGGLAGVLAGARLLGVGGWPVPAALAAGVAGAAGIGLVRALKES